MRECWIHRRRRKCPRPPRRVHIGDQPFQVKQLAYAVSYEERRENHCDPWDGGGCGCQGGMRPHPPFWWDREEEEPTIPAIPSVAMQGIEPENGSFSFASGEEDRDSSAGRRRPHPPFPWGPRPHHCPDCNMKIKVLKLDGCRKAKANAAIGLFWRGRLIRVEETNSHGEVVFNYLAPGMYTVQELDRQDGSDVDTTRYAVFLGEECAGVTVVLKKGNCRKECPDLWRWQSAYNPESKPEVIPKPEPKPEPIAIEEAQMLG